MFYFSNKAPDAMLWPRRVPESRFSRHDTLLHTCCCSASLIFYCDDVDFRTSLLASGEYTNKTSKKSNIYVRGNNIWSCLQFKVSLLLFQLILQGWLKGQNAFMATWKFCIAASVASTQFCKQGLEVLLYWGRNNGLMQPVDLIILQ